MKFFQKIKRRERANIVFAEIRTIKDKFGKKIHIGDLLLVRIEYGAELVKVVGYDPLYQTVFVRFSKYDSEFEYNVDDFYILNCFPEINQN